MGRRVIVALAELIHNPALQITLTTECNEEVDLTCHLATITAKYNNGTLQEYVMDVSLSGKEIMLEADFNLWGSNHSRYTELFHNFGICYRVV